MFSQVFFSAGPSAQATGCGIIRIASRKSMQGRTHNPHERIAMIISTVDASTTERYQILFIFTEPMPVPSAIRERLVSGDQILAM